MSDFTILTDTNTDLPADYFSQHEIMIVPIAFQLDGKFHNSGNYEEITAKDFYSALRNGSTAGTALANVETFTEVFTDHAQKGKAILAITLSGELSGTYQNGVIARNDVKSQYPDAEIYVVDSINAAGGAGVVTALAVEKRSEGLTAGQTAAWLEEKKHSCIALFTVDDLMHLHRGGRLSKLSAIAGSIIGIKPLLNVAPDGSLKLKDRARGRSNSINTLFSQMQRSLNPDTKLNYVIISHSDCYDDAKKLADLIENAYEVNNLMVEMMGPVIGTHVGPGAIALFFEGDMTRREYESKYYPA
ncbi:MAG: DegV family protein [Oscillospiraceae bacterium]|nr:DegV family protein [Oscillospiraceae bacterium]